jgi:hypothetical protein
MTPLIISLGCCLFRAICEVMKGGAEIYSVTGKKKSACCLEPCPREHGVRDLQFRRISDKLSLVDCMSILPIGPVSEPSFLPEQLFGDADLAPNGALRTNAKSLSCNRRSLFQRPTRQRRFSESVVASYSLCQTYNDKARGLISA